MKAILVIDMPKCCAECPLMLWDAESEYYGACCPTLKEDNCVADSYKENENKGTKPNWCPLKPMPKKTGQKPYCRTKQECVNLGWDACIEEINKPSLGTDEGWWRDYELYEMQTD